ncbi:hypothetical protein HNP40_002391 [Mycobacteroides chelonae]|nr:hypothetical protein [Mycobacteroides chelonae]
MPTSRWCAKFVVPERSWRRWQHKAKVGRVVKGPWPALVRDRAREEVRGHALARPEWGHRKIWAMYRHDGQLVSQATVLRASTAASNTLIERMFEC